MSRFLAAGVLAFAAFSMVGPATAGASTIAVTTTADQNNAAPNNGQCSLREAIYAASNNVVSDTCIAGSTTLDTISVPAGTYKITGAAGEDANAVGDYDLTGGGPVLIDGGSGARPVLDGAGLDRVLQVGTNAATELRHLEIDNGRSPVAGSPAARRGGGVLALSPLTVTDSAFKANTSQSEAGGAIGTPGPTVPVTILNSQFDGNSSNLSGGAVFALGTLKVTGSRFTNNKAGPGPASGVKDGGAILAAGPDTPSGTGHVVDIDTSTFSGNSTTTADAFGGAVAIDATGAAASDYSVTNSAFTNNVSDGYGGGLSFTPGAATRVLVLDRLTFDGNQVISEPGKPASGGAIKLAAAVASISHSYIHGNTVASDTQVHGGGISGSSDVTMVVSDTAISGNSIAATAGEAAGGGIYGYSGHVALLRTTVANNSAKGGQTFGGGIDSGPGVTGTVDVVNSTIAGNSAGPGDPGTGDGGGIDAEGSAVRLFSSTLADNTAYAGRAVNLSNGATLTTTNSILTAGGNTPICYGGTVTSGGHNVATGGTCGLTAAGDKQGNPNLDLGTLGDNSGPAIGAPGATSVLQTVPIGDGSAAIDHGDKAHCVDQSAAYLTTDERGKQRVGSCDTGAYEKQPGDPGFSNNFKFGKLKLNRKKGTGRLQVKVPGPGKVAIIGGKIVKSVKKTAKKKSTVTLPIKLKGKAARILSHSAAIKISIPFKFTPTGGESRVKYHSVKLVRKG